MTLVNCYTDLATMKSADVLKISATDTTSDTILESIIEAASRTIDSDCARFFYKSATDETRYYTAEFPDKLFLSDDVVSITTLATDVSDDRTWTEIWSASADYDLVPYNAAASGKPYTAIEVLNTSAYSFPCYRKGVKIVGIFGYPAIPAKITQAAILLSARMFKRLSTPLGTASMAAFGEVQVSIKDKDPDYWHLIREFVRIV
jgi:hypothetical protein